MGRIRTIKPEFPQSESMGSVSRDARLCFIMMWTVADDEGRLRGNSRMLAGLLFPYDMDAPSLIDSWLDELGLQKCIRRYEVNGRHYIEIINWHKQQKIDRPNKSRLPISAESLPISPPVFARIREDSLEAREYSPNGREQTAEDLRIKDQGRDQGPKDQGEEAARNLVSPAAGFSQTGDFTADAHMIAKEVSAGIGVTRWQVYNQIAKQAELTLSEGKVDKDTLLNGMIGEYKTQRECLRQGRLKFDWGVEKFFGDGLWKDRQLWGFKKGMDANGISV